MSLATQRRARLLSSIYATFGEDAVWTPADGREALTVRVIPSEREEEIDYGNSRALALANFLRIRRSEANPPEIGDLFAIDGGTDQIFKVTAQPRLRQRGLEWSCEVKKVSA